MKWRDEDLMLRLSGAGVAILIVIEKDGIITCIYNPARETH